MKADDVVPTFVLLNIVRANLCQHFLIGNDKNKLTQVNFFNDLTAFAECVLPFGRTSARSPEGAAGAA